MAESITLARPYAKAAFQVALAENGLAQWSQMLSTLAAVSAHDKVSALLSHPGLTAEQHTDVLRDILGDELTEKGQNLVNLLADNRRLALLPQIFELFEAHKAEHEKSVDVELTTAYALSDELVEQLANALQKRLEREVKIHSHVDKHLIGGVVIRAGDTVIDNSVRGKLNKLAESLSS